jgi:ABC-2 type transport system ATP-binding protein
VSTPAIATSGLSKDFGSGHGLFGLDLEVRQGEVFGFLGPNGAGKSTTLRLLLDLIKPTAGSARVLGLDTANESLAIRRRVGFLPGDLAMYPRLTGQVVLDFLAQLRGGVDQRVRDSLVERFDADLNRPIRQLSTGNRQKLGLVQAFMHEPELLILDEPIAGLDPLVQRSFHALLAEVSAQGRTVLRSSHTLSEVERVTHRLAILREGRLVVVDSLENLRQGRGAAVGDRVRCCGRYQRVSRASGRRRCRGHRCDGVGELRGLGRCGGKGRRQPRSPRAATA